MKFTRGACFLLLTSFLVNVAPTAFAGFFSVPNPELRVWTDEKGREVSAVLDSYDRRTVSLNTEGSTGETTIPRKDLSQLDQTYVDIMERLKELEGDLKEKSPWALIGGYFAVTLLILFISLLLVSKISDHSNTAAMACSVIFRIVIVNIPLWAIYLIISSAISYNGGMQTPKSAMLVQLLINLPLALLGVFLILRQYMNVYQASYGGGCILIFFHVMTHSLIMAALYFAFLKSNAGAEMIEFFILKQQFQSIVLMDLAGL